MWVGVPGGPTNPMAGGVDWVLGEGVLRIGGRSASLAAVEGEGGVGRAKAAAIAAPVGVGGVGGEAED